MYKTASHNELLTELQDSFTALGREIRMQHGEAYTCVTPALDKVLLVTGSLKGVNIKQLATLLLITPGAATQHVAVLEKLGAINRVVNDTDRREVIIRLTAYGADIYKKIRSKQLKLMKEIFGALDEEELQTMVQLMHKVSQKSRQEAAL
jgi:DNA-binding MarR family transcriptional regulator